MREPYVAGMARGAPSSLMTALGFPRSVQVLYDQVLTQSGRELVSVAQSLGVTPEELERRLRPLLEHGIASIDGTRLHLVGPVEAVGAMLSETAASAARAHSQLAAVATAIPFLTASRNPHADPGSEVVPLDGELSAGGDVGALVQALVPASRGDLLWLRPDQFRKQREEAMAAMVGAAVAEGRRSRAIYPVRAVTEVPEILAHRAAVGEEVRVLPELPTRMLVIGATHALLPEPLGYVETPRALIRQRGVVQALTLWFEALWERAAPVTGLDGGDARPDVRRFLLEQLASGAQDEQIARRLGVSLRTVRRRVADLLAELGAESRFQAGVEAARRGWI